MRKSLRSELTRAAAILAHSAEPEGVRALAVTAAARGEGVTTITTQLARALVEDLGLRVLVVDLADDGAPPVIAGTTMLREDAVAATDARWALVRLASGPLPALKQRLSALLDAAAARFDLVLIDAPPLDEGLATLVAARACGQALLVIRAGNLPHETLQRLRDELAEAEVGILGVILNQRREVVPAWIGRLLR